MYLFYDEIHVNLTFIIEDKQLREQSSSLNDRDRFRAHGNKCQLEGMSYTRLTVYSRHV